MRIRKPKPAEPREGQVNYGVKSHGKRKLVHDVMELGFSLRTATKAVDAVIGAWKRAIAAKEQHIEMPMGRLKVKKTPKRISKKRYATRKIGNRQLNRLVTWTTYNDPYRITWWMPEQEWAELLCQVNGLTPSQENAETILPLRKARKSSGTTPSELPDLTTPYGRLEAWAMRQDAMRRR